MRVTQVNQLLGTALAPVVGVKPQIWRPIRDAGLVSHLQQIELLVKMERRRGRAFTIVLG